MGFLAVQANGPTGSFRGAEEKLRGLRSTRANQPGKAQHLAFFDLKTEVVHAVPGEVLHIEHDLIGNAGLARRVGFLQFPPHHQFHEVIEVGVARLDGGDLLAIPQDGDAFGEPKDFLHPVGNIDDGHAGHFQPLDHFIESLGLC